jgi:hypothetical protein
MPNGMSLTSPQNVSIIFGAVQVALCLVAICIGLYIAYTVRKRGGDQIHLMN